MTNHDSHGWLQKLISYVTRDVLNPRFIKFGIVGTSGIAVNMGMLYVLTDLGGVPYFLASIVAIELAIMSNFSINHLWTWRDRSEHGTVWGKLVRYHIGAGATGFLGNYLILVALTELVGLHYLVSNLIGIGVGTMFNYVINDLWTFKKSSEPQRPSS